MKRSDAEESPLTIIAPNFAGQFDVLGHATGLHLVAQFHDKIFTREIVNEIADNGVRVYPIGSFYIEKEPAHNNKIILGYSHLPPEKIAEGIEIISRVISQLPPRPRR